MPTSKLTVPVNQFFQVFLFSAALVLSETVFGQLVTYCTGRAYGSLFGPGMYLALSAGSFLAFKKASNLKLDVCPFITAALVVLIAIIGFAHIPTLAVFWGIIPFLVFGYILNSFYMTCSLRMLLLAASTGVLSMILVLKCLTLESDARYYPLGITAALLLCGLLIRPKMRNFIAVILIAGVSTSGFFAGYLNPSAGMIRNTPSLNDGSLLHPTIMTPWIYTDLVKTKEGPYIVTNGSRFSKVVLAPPPPMTWQDRARQYMDEAFILSKAKSVLIIGPAGGANVGRALQYNVESIDAVDINPAVFQFMTTKLRRVTRRLYLDPRVHLIVSEGRHFMETTSNKYDVIFIQGVRTGTTFSSIDASMLESYILTPQSVRTMWDHLTDSGIILLEDYFAPALSDDLNSSYLRNIQNQLTRVLPITEPDKQVLYYLGRRKVPLSQDDFYRNVPNEVLLISKQPILSQEAVENSLQPLTANLDFVPFEAQKSILPLPISDDRPFHNIEEIQNILLVTLALAAFGVIALVLLFNRKSNKVSGKYGFMFLSGLGYILVFMGLLGKAHMILGQPQLSATVMLFSFYLFSLPAGIWATRMRFSSTIWAMIGATIWTAAVATIFYFYQAEMIKITSQLVQICILVGIAAVFAALTEIPYIALLAETEQAERGKQFAVGKLGAAFGVIVGFCVQLLFGYIAVFATGFCFLLICVFYYHCDQIKKTINP